MDGYKLIIKEDPFELEEIVKAHMEAGFKPHGSAFVYGNSIVQPMVYSKPKLSNPALVFLTEIIEERRKILEKVNPEDKYLSLINWELLKEIDNYLSGESNER